MKPAILIVFLSAVFAGHYLAHAQSMFIEHETELFFSEGKNLSNFEQEVHAQYQGPREIPVFGEEAVKNYADSHEALRQFLTSECNSLDSEVVVRVAIDEKGEILSSHLPDKLDQDDEDVSSIFDGISFKKAFVKGLSLFDLTFSFIPNR